MIELSFILAFLLFKYAIPDAVASVNGKPTARARDATERADAAAKVADARREANLGPTPGEVVKAAIATRIASWIQPGAPKPPKEPQEPGLLRGIWQEWWGDVKAEAQHRWRKRRMDRLNEQRRRDGLPVLDVDAVPGDPEATWCDGCEVRAVDRPGDLCPACEAAADEDAAPPVPLCWACGRNRVPHAGFRCDDCLSAESAAPRPTAWPCRAGCGTPVAVENTNCPDCQRRYREQLDGVWCARCAVHRVEQLGDLCPLCAPPATNDTPSSELICRVCEAQVVGGSTLDAMGRCPLCAPDDPHSWPCKHRCGRPVNHADSACAFCLAGRCSACGVADVDQPGRLCPSCARDDAEHAADDEDYPPLWIDPGVDPDEPPETPEPNPAPVNHREDTPAMTETIDINGDVNDPTGALAFVEANDDWLINVNAQLETLAGNARAGGVGPAVDQVDQLRADITGCRGGIGRAAEKFRVHVGVQGDVNSDADAAGIVADTYLGAQT